MDFFRKVPPRPGERPSRRLTHLRPKLVLQGPFDDSALVVASAVGRRRLQGSTAHAGEISLPGQGSRQNLLSNPLPPLPQIFTPRPTLGWVPMSQQARKEEEAAARDLLEVAAARVRKASAATSTWKAMMASTRKAAMARVPEQTSSGCVAATATRSFTDRSYFNGSGSVEDFFGILGHSSQPWNQQSSDPPMW